MEQDYCACDSVVNRLFALVYRSDTQLRSPKSVSPATPALGSEGATAPLKVAPAPAGSVCARELGGQVQGLLVLLQYRIFLSEKTQAHVTAVASS